MVLRMGAFATFLARITIFSGVALALAACAWLLASPPGSADPWGAAPPSATAELAAACPAAGSPSTCCVPCAPSLAASASAMSFQTKKLRPVFFFYSVGSEEELHRPSSPGSAQTRQGRGRQERVGPESRGGRVG